MVFGPLKVTISHKNITITTNFNKTYDLSSLLPDDDNIYEVIIGSIIRTGSDLNNCVGVTASTELCNTVLWVEL